MKRNIFTTALYLSALFSLSACEGVQPKPDEIHSANYGQKPTTERMIATVKNYMSKKLIDPYSAVYECSEPRKSWIVAGAGSEGNVNFNRTYYGYFSTCFINAKNRLGGYTGRQEYYFMIYPVNGGTALAHFDGFQSGGPVPE